MARHKRCGSECGSEAAGSSRKANKRQITKSTFDKWQQEHERDHQTRSWLRCDLERDKHHVASLYCAVCKKYEHSLQSLKSFSRAWITGSTNHKVSNVLDHANSEVHKVAMTRKRARRCESERRVCCVVFHYRALFGDVGQRNSSTDGEKVRRVLHDG